MSIIETLIRQTQYGVLILLLIASCVQAKQEIGDQVVNEEKMTSKDVENIEVIGKKPRNLLLKELYRHEDNFYDLYNELVEENEFRMDCGMTSKDLSSKVKHRTCIPRFVGIEKSKELQVAAVRTGRLDAGSLLGSVPDSAGMRLIYQKKRKEMAEKMADLITANPELAERYFKYVDAKAKYDNYESP